MSEQFIPLEADPEAYQAMHRILDEPAADAMLSRRELEVRGHAREIVAHKVAPASAKADAIHEFAAGSVQALAEANLMGLVFPKDLGGTGDSNVAYAAAMEEITAGCAATSLIFMTQMHAAYPILLAGSKELAEKHIPPLLNGSNWGSLAITEPDAGSDVASLRTTATKVEGGYRISGSKTFITTGDRCDTIICFASVDRTKGRQGITAFVVDGNAQGVTRGQPFHKMGMHASSTAEVFFDSVFVPDDHLLGEPGGGWSVVMSSVVKSRISAAAQGVGLARAAYARTLHALKHRYGTRIPDELTFALATLRGRILQGRLLLLAVARQVDEDPKIAPGQIGIMKQSCTDLGWEVSVECTRILGAFGDFKELGVERCLRDSKVTQIYDGTNEVQRLLIGRETNRAMEAMS
ncbi:acyl-CoA dehydrogenase family protein [Arthrobacter sp. NPDC080031]|uniref:acyl-CoA dehydrogenase family protein n=1 Tax=Arthrobacter sp. NPDC080031 TaxID=3155918 RepID=UPI003450DF42